MKKEIGGYFEMETMQGQEYYPDLYRVNLGRTALLWLLEARGYKKILLPGFLCESVPDAVKRTDVKIETYSLDPELRVLLPEKKLDPDTCLYLVSYYGQLTDEAILKYRDIYGTIIVDHTHAFYQKPLKGVDTLYSCRKFWGVSDGAYLATDASLSMDKPQDCSGGRLKHILGRYEENAGKYYQSMLKNASGYEEMEIRLMSPLTENLLRGIDYAGAKKTRENNYRILSEQLASENVFTRTVPEGPFAYPFYHKKGTELRRWLAERKIFVPTYWKNILETCPGNSLEYDWAANVLPLPCDQRYGKEEMEFICASIREWEAMQK